jgi:hypothetical protein
MAPARAKRTLADISREHLRLCADIVDTTPGLMRATSVAARSLRAADLRQAASSEENAARLRGAVLDAFIQGSPPDPVVSYVFYASIFVAAVQAGIDEPLAPMAGASAALDLTQMLLMALQSGAYEFILGGAGDMLDKLGDMLGEAYYKVLANGFRLAATRKVLGNPSSALEKLDIETQLEAHRMEMRKQLPIARRECEGDETRNQMLDTFEGMLLSARSQKPTSSSRPQETPMPLSDDDLKHLSDSQLERLGLSLDPTETAQALTELLRRIRQNEVTGPLHGDEASYKNALERAHEEIRARRAR